MECTAAAAHVEEQHPEEKKEPPAIPQPPNIHDYDDSTEDSNLVLSGDFPVGLRVLLVEHNQTALLVLQEMLRRCMYQVTTCQRSRDAVALLREDKDMFDIVLCDVHMPEVDGFKILDIAALEMDLPVVLMSSDDHPRVVMNAVFRGVSDYLIKPVTMENVQVIWQHVIRKKMNNALRNGNQCPRRHQPLLENSHRSVLPPIEQSDNYGVENHNNGATSSSTTTSLKKINVDHDNDGGSSEDHDRQREATTKGKKRMVWTQDLHYKFLDAINILEPSNVVPTKILECMQRMGVEGITRENVASHLQKYRMQQRKQQEHQHESLLLYSSSSTDLHHQFHPPFVNGPCGLSMFATASISMDTNDMYHPGTSLVDDHHHQMSNNNIKNYSQIFQSSHVVFTQPHVEADEKLPNDITVGRDQLLDVSDSHHDHFDDQIAILNGIYPENVADSLETEDYNGNPWHFHQHY